MKQITAPMASTKIGIILFSAMCLLAGTMLAQDADAINIMDQVDQSGKPTATLAVIENPEIVARVLESLLRSILYPASVEYQSIQNGAQKRGLDLGISRGFSGSQAGKHLMGLSAASFANGPGRR